MLSVCALAEVSSNPFHMNPAATSAVAPQASTETRKSTSGFAKNKRSRRSPLKYARNATRASIKQRKTKRKGTAQTAAAENMTCDSEVKTLSERRQETFEKAQPLMIPRIDIVQASPTLGSRSPDIGLVRSPSLPAVLPQPIPAYNQARQPLRPDFSRVLTSPSMQVGETATSSSITWEGAAEESGNRLPLLPLPGTPAIELTGHSFNTGANGPPLHTCGTDTTQSMPVTFDFPQSNASRSYSFPSGGQNDDYAPTSTRQTSSSGSKQSSRSGSLSSSVSRLTNQVRVLRVTNPDPPSPVRSAAPSRTPSMTIAQKRFVSCPPAPLLVNRANEYKGIPSQSTPAFDSPMSRSTGTPTSGSNSASTPSFRFSDGGRSPTTPASALSSLSATPTKPSLGSTYTPDLHARYKGPESTRLVYPDQIAVWEAPILAPPVERSVGNTVSKPSISVLAKDKPNKAVRKKKEAKFRQLKRCKSTSSGDGDNSEGVESCFESVGASTEGEHVTLRKKRGRTKAKTPKVKQTTVTSLAQGFKPAHATETQQKRADSPQKSKMLQDTSKEEAPKSPRSPLLLDKPRVTAISNTPHEANMENLTTFWTPMGRVIVAPIASAWSSALKSPGSPASPIVPPSLSKEGDRNQTGLRPQVQDECKSGFDGSNQIQDKAITPRAFLVPPRSPRPPNTRRLGHGKDPLSRSELYPPQYEQRESLLSVPQSSTYQAEGKNGSGVANISLSLSLPLPSPIKLDAFTTELIARCNGIGIDNSRPDSSSAFPIGLNTGRRSSVEDILEDTVKKKTSHDKEGKALKEKKALPSPRDPFIASSGDVFNSCEVIEDLSADTRPRPPYPQADSTAFRLPSAPVSVYKRIVSPTTRGVKSTDVQDDLRNDLNIPEATYQFNNGNKRFASLPYSLPPPLPPRPGKRRDAAPDIEELREQLVVNGALVSGGEDNEDAKYRRSRRHNPLSDGVRYDNNEEDGRNKGEKRRHNHKKATLYTQQNGEENLINPIKKAYPDGVALMEYERARSLQTARAQPDGYSYEYGERPSMHCAGKRDTQIGKARDVLPVPTPSAYLEQRLERASHAQDGFGRKGYAGNHTKQMSSFEALKRRDDAYSRYDRECGHERSRGRDRHKQDRASEFIRAGREGFQYLNQERDCHRHVRDMKDVLGLAENLEEAEEGAIRLGEHKRGFDTGEIERWLEGLRRAARSHGEDDREETGMMVDTC